MGERPETWWRYLEQTAGTPIPPELGDLRATGAAPAPGLPPPGVHGEDLHRTGQARRDGAHGLRLRLRRRARGATSKARRRASRDAVLATVEARDFGGPAFKEYWRRQALDAVASCEEWARETRERLVSSGGEWELEIVGHTVRGRHGPVVEESGEHVLLRVKTGKNPMKQGGRGRGPRPRALGPRGRRGPGEVRLPEKALLRRARRARARHLGRAGGIPGEAAAAIAEMEAGEIPARPRSAEICDRCAFMSICPLHMEDEPWAG